MVDINKVKEELNSLLDLKDTEAIEKVAEIGRQLDSLSTERDGLIADKGELTRKYREAVLNAKLEPSGKPDETGSSTEKGKSLEECFAEIVAKRK